MKDIDAQLMMEALRPNDRRDAYRGQGVDPETGEKQSGDEHAKHVQWTKDIKAKLAQAQSTGDSKIANKLQRYLDMHGIDEADAPGNSLDKPRVGDEATGDPSTFQVGQILRTAQTGDHLDGMIINISEEDGELSFDLMEIGEEGWTVKVSELRPAAGNPPIDAPTASFPYPGQSKGLGGDRSEDKWTT